MATPPQSMSCIHARPRKVGGSENDPKVRLLHSLDPSQNLHSARISFSSSEGRVRLEDRNIRDTTTDLYTYLYLEKIHRTFVTAPISDNTVVSVAGEVLAHLVLVWT